MRQNKGGKSHFFSPTLNFYAASVFVPIFSFIGKNGFCLSGTSIQKDHDGSSEHSAPHSDGAVDW